MNTKLSNKVVNGINKFKGADVKIAIVKLVANLTILYGWNVSVGYFSNQPSVVLTDKNSNAITIVQVMDDKGKMILIFNISKTDEDIYSIDKSVTPKEMFIEIYRSYKDWQMIIE